jgi:hypothetical protein
MNNKRCNSYCNKAQNDGFCSILFADYEHLCPCIDCPIRIMCTKNCKEYDVIVQHCSTLTLSRYDTYKEFHNVSVKWKENNPIIKRKDYEQIT